MTTYHCPLWLVDWDYEEDEEMNPVTNWRGHLVNVDAATTRLMLDYLDRAHGRANDLQVEVVALAARVTALEAGLRDLLPGAQWTARFDPDLRATVERIDALLHDTTSADEREAQHEPPFAVLPEVY